MHNINQTLMNGNLRIEKFKGNDVLVLEPDSKYKLRIGGVNKCRKIMDKLADIRRHVIDFQEMAGDRKRSANIPDFEIENGDYDPIMLSYYKCEKILEYQGEIRNFIND